MEITKIYLAINKEIDQYVNEGVKDGHILNFLNSSEDNFKFLYNKLYKKLTMENVQFESDVLLSCMKDAIRDRIALYNDTVKNK